MRFLFLLLFFGFIGYTILPESSSSTRPDGLLVEDFEADTDFSLPSRWVVDYGRGGYNGAGQDMNI